MTVQERQEIYDVIVHQLDAYLARRGVELWQIARQQLLAKPWLKLPDTQYWQPLAHESRNHLRYLLGQYECE